MDRMLEQRIVAMRPRVGGIVNSVFRNVPPSMDREDMIQAGMVGVCVAALRWDPQKGLFVSYVTSRAIGAIKDHLDHERRSYRVSDSDGRQHRKYPMDTVELDENHPTEEGLLEVWDAIERALTKVECDTLKRWLNGWTAVAISKQDGVTEGAISHRLNRCRRKLEPILRKS